MSSSKGRAAARVCRMLDQLVIDFPRRKRAAEAAFSTAGLPGTLELQIAAAERLDEIPTFARGAVRPPTAMLAARFAYAGLIRVGPDLWLSPGQMLKYSRSRAVRDTHRSFRAHRERSAPMQFPGDRLALFGVTDGVPENLVYLVWRRDAGEPEVWSYAGWEEYIFRDLAAFLTWHLERK